MESFSQIKDKKRGKLLFKAPIFLLALFASLFVFSEKAEAYTYFTSFEASEGYSTGFLDLQNNWSSTSSFSGVPVEVSASSSYSGSYSVKADTSSYSSAQMIMQNLQPLTNGQLSFRFEGSREFYITILDNTPFVYSGNYSAQPYASSTGWHLVDIQFNIVATALQTRWRLDASAWTSWINTSKPTGDPSGFQIVSYYGYPSPGINYIDDIAWGESSEVFSGSVDPAYPPEGITTYLSGQRLQFLGSYSYDSSQLSDVWAVYLGFDLESATSTTSYFLQDVSNATTGVYVANEDLPNGLFNVRYFFLVESSILYPTFYASVATTTILVSGSTYMASSSVPILPVYQEEDCSGYNWITNGFQRLFCEAKNFATKAFFPSPAKVEELNATIRKPLTLFPINFLSITKDFVVDLNDQLSTISPMVLSLSLFGHTSTTTLNIFTKNISFFGLTLDFNDFLKLFFKLISVPILVGYSIWFIGKLF